MAVGDGVSFLFNATAWLRHTRQMSPLARTVYMDVVLHLVTLGEFGVIDGPEDAGGMKQLEELTGMTPDMLRTVWPEVAMRLEADDNGAYYHVRARALARQSLAVHAMDASMDKMALARLKGQKKNVVRYADLESDGNFRRFWRVTPVGMRRKGVDAWRVWAKRVSPHGQEFIERVLQKWAAYVVRQDVARGDGQWKTAKEWLDGQGWCEGLTELDR